jgi:hypothetical protein
VIDGAVDLLAELKGRSHATLGLLTGNTAGGAATKVGHFGLAAYFPFGAYGCDHHDRNRLGPIAQQRAAAHAGRDFSADQTWIIGDTPKDIACAKAIGARCLAVATGRFTTTELEAHGADRVVMRKKLDELQAQEEEQWFSHSSLEATDSLKESHRAETERVEKELGRAESALEALGNNPNGNPAEQARLMEAFDQVVEGLRNGAMKPNPELLEQMQKLDLKNLDQLTPEQLKQLGENLKKHAKCLGKCNGEGKDQGLADGNGEGKKADDEAEGLGKGGISRGPGHDPNLLGEEKEAVQTGETSPLETRDLSKSAPGDLLELQENEHDVDLSASRLSAGGNTDSTGTGGDRIWKESLDPDEQRVLKKFFE